MIFNAMKDIKITTKRQKIEIIWLVASFCIAILLNVFSIIFYKTAWSELYSQTLWVLTLTGILYALSVGIRVGIWVVIYLYKRYFTRR